MRILHLLFLASALLFPQLALAQSECKFAYEERLIESTGAAFQILDLDGNPTTIKGNWTPIRARGLNDRIRKFARSIGRMDVCWENEDGKSAITYCTATLLDKNRILTNFHCTNPGEGSRLTQLGYFAVDARLLMGFEDQFETEGVSSYRVVLPARIGSPVDEADAQIFKVLGKPNIKWGETKLRVADRFDAGEAMIIVHHPAGMVKMFSSVRCNIKDSQAKADANVIRHECDTAGGSSGSLLLRERDLAIVGLHHQGGLTPEDHRSFNQAIRFGFVAEKMALAVMLEEGDVTFDACDEAKNDWAQISETGDVADYQEFITKHAACAEFVKLAVDGMLRLSQTPKEEEQNVGEDAELLAKKCDVLAHSPSNSDNPNNVKGHRYKEINTAAAIAACTDAVAANPTVLRLRFQLGRALVAAKQYEKAVQVLTVAAQQGYPAAQFNMGWLFDKGTGVQKSDVEAISWYRKAADQGLAAAQNNLGLKYEKGNGISKDVLEALRLYLLARQSGSDVAMQNINRLYKNSSAARELQKSLSDLGFYDGPVDGAFGKGSRAAMRAYCNCDAN